MAPAQRSRSVPNSDPAALAERGRINQQNPGFGARTFAHIRRYTVVLSQTEAERLATFGVLVDASKRIVPIGDSGAFQIVPAA
jgi:hypothetical protein